MRKWWVALAVVVGFWWGGGQQVAAALPYQDLLFENVTWGPGQRLSGAIYSPPSELWVKVDTIVPLYFYRTRTANFSDTKGQAINFHRRDKDDQGAELLEEINQGESPDASVILKPRTLGIQNYEIQVPSAGPSYPELNMTLKLHVIENIPKNLHVNIQGLEIFEFVPLQLFPVDAEGHKYAVKMEVSNADGSQTGTAVTAPLIFPKRLPGLSNSIMNVYMDPNGADKILNSTRIQIGPYTSIHQPNPITVDQKGDATVKLPVIWPPSANGQARLVWSSLMEKGATLPIQSDGTVHFSNLKQTSFPMTWRIEYKATPFVKDDEIIPDYDSFTYANIQGKFISLQSLDLPSIPFPPLFSGTYTLSQIANGPISVAPTWQQLDITASGPWALQMSIKAPTALPMRLRLAAQETGNGEGAIAITGTGSQTVSLAESRLIIPKMPLLSPGEYTADITFNLIRGPTP